MGGTAFSEVFKPRCFPPLKDSRELKMGQELPAGFTISSFLDRLQLLEHKLAERNPGGPLKVVDMAVYVLRTFYHSDYDWKNLGILDNAASLRNIVHHVMEAVTANLGRPSISPQDLLDDQQRKDDDLCFLMFSMAHNVNKTIERPDRFETYSANEYDDDIKKRPREEGVLSVTGRKDGSVVALGKTLLGIAAAHKDLQPKSIKDVVKTLNSEAGDVTSEGSLNPVYAATLGSVVAGASLTLTTQQLKTMGMQGKWLEHGCFLEYKLNQDTNTSATLAEITGAIDGLILGTALNKFPDLRNWNLSTVLRLYYGPRGIVTGAAQPLSHCRRRELFGGLTTNELREQVQNFAITLAYMGLVAVDKENVAKQRASQALSMVQAKLGDMDKDSSNGEVCPSGVIENQPECETPTDLLVVLDTSTDVINFEPKKELQSEILAMITKWMKFQPGISSISLFASKRNSDVLRDIISNSAAGGCPGCAALYLQDLKDISATGSDSDQDVFNMLNNVVSKHISPTDERPGVASRVVVYLNLRKKATGGAHGNQRQVEEALNRFRVANPDVPIFAIGFKDVIDTLNRNSGVLMPVDLTSVLSDETPKLENLRTNNDLIGLAKKICLAPASLRHKYCEPRNSRARSQTKFVGAVTSGAVQYWSYSTVSFSASKNLQIKFTTNEWGNIKVCDVTGRALDGNLMGLRCYETNAQFKTLTFNYTRPCKKGPLSCSPLTYAVVGKDENVPQINFDASTCEGFCRNPQQIKFEVEHEGMYCAGVLSAMFSPFTLLLTVLALLRHWVS